MIAADPIAEHVEEIAVFFEEAGLPRISGRVIGHLLVCDPPHRSAVQLADELGASRASISTMTRLLLTSNFIEKVGILGDRTTYFRIKNDGFESHFQAKITSLAQFRSLAARGLEALSAQPQAGRADRLREIFALYCFLEKELPKIFARWHEQREQLIAATYEDDG